VRSIIPTRKAEKPEITINEPFHQWLSGMCFFFTVPKKPFGIGVVLVRKRLPTQYTGIDETATQATGGRVTGLRAGAVNNRQLAIYDKRVEVMQKAKDGWLEIWNAERKACGQDPLNLADADQSQIWRFELRLGQKQLRGKFEMHTWQDLRDTLGDAYNDALGRLRYCIPNGDSSHSAQPAPAASTVLPALKHQRKKPPEGGS
jgi:hypothetical protein